MAKSHSFLRPANALFPLRDFLYLLQLEEYEVAGYVHRLRRLFFKRHLERRDTLRFTGRIFVVGALTKVLIALLVVVVGVVTQSWFAVVLAVVACCVAMPLLVLLANVLTLPMFRVAHARVRAQAARKVASMPNLRVVAIAGSHGKTTTKNLLYQMVQSTRRTQMIGGNINTPTGVAQWVLQHLQPQTELLVVEMDAYRIGEIAQTCAVTPADVAVITAIGDQHLTRFGSQDNIVRGISEVFTTAKVGAQKFCTPETGAMLTDIGLVTTWTDVTATVGAADKFSDSIREDAALAAAAAGALGVPERFVDEACRTFTPPDRRQKPANVFGYEGIDDSYNISQATAHAGVMAAKAMADKTGKKLLVLTGGIPELPAGMGVAENRKYGDFLAQHTDAVLLLLSEFAPAIRNGLADNVAYKEAHNLQEAAALMHTNFPTDEYILLFQPELTDASY